MHELSIAMSILDVAGEEAVRQNVRVLVVRLRLGPLSGVVKEALLSSYEMARVDSLVPDSCLEIEEVAILMNCPACGQRQPVESIQQLRCATCGTPAYDIAQGRELEVVGLEVVDLEET